MKQEIEYISHKEESKGEIQTFEATLPNGLPARLTNKCEAKYKATVKSQNGSKTAEMDDPFNAIKEVKEEVIRYLTTDHIDGVEWIKQDVDSSQIRNGDDIVANYEEDLYGVAKKKEGGSKNDVKDTSDSGAKETK